MPAFKQARSPTSGPPRPLLAGAVVALASVLLSQLPAVAQTPSLSVTTSGPAEPVALGVTFAYTIGVSNGGTGPATEVVVEDTLPSAVGFAAASVSPTGSCSHDGKGGMVTCRLGQVEAGASVDVRIDVVAGAAARVENRVRVTSSNGEELTATAATELCHIAGGPGADVLRATDPAGQRICGGSGRDVLIGGDGPDVLVGGPGRDRLEGRGGDDLLEGGPGLDILLGGPGNDVLRGEEGPDYLDGGEGDDVIDPGPGVNTCVEHANPPACYPTSPEDAADTSGSLDLRRVQTSFGAQDSVWKLVSYSRWGSRALWDRGYLLVLLDTAGDIREDYLILVRSNGRRIIATLFWGGVKVTNLPVWRDGRWSVSVRLPMSRLSVSRGFFRWRAATQYGQNPCRRDWCVDGAPDDAWLIQPV